MDDHTLEDVVLGRVPATEEDMAALAALWERCVVEDD